MSQTQAARSEPSVALGVGLTAVVFLLVQLGALALVPDFSAAGLQATPDPSDPTNAVVYVGAILVMTGLMLAAFKFGVDQLVRIVILLTSGLLSWYVFAVVLPGPAAVVAAALVPVALLVYPEWYVIDATGAVIGAAAAGVFGISFGLLPAILLLIVLAVYDAISVYGTEHMLDLASGVMDLNIPVVLVIPLTLEYSLLDDDPAAEAAGLDETEAAETDPSDGTEAAETAAGGRAGTVADGSGSTDTTDVAPPDADTTDDPTERTTDDDGERDVFFVGLGDAVMPTVLVASAAFFSPAPSLGVPGLAGLNLPALLGMVGTFAGLAVLLKWVLAGRAHAGLPLLNGGTLAGYLVGSVLAGVPLVTALGLGPYL
ncbi:presenilin family intramembrane aspartyl protease PSH [Halobaculum sp. MBLA0147]|uniref:presenilin family intramembrane aspartyl protease PSH n=1 Tax=Halobaculum sp. MBLA0147 TaxID=3079934 RepID=UPI0035233E13